MPISFDLSILSFGNGNHPKIHFLLCHQILYHIIRLLTLDYSLPACEKNFGLMITVSNCLVNSRRA